MLQFKYNILIFKIPSKFCDRVLGLGRLRLHNLSRLLGAPVESSGQPIHLFLGVFGSQAESQVGLANFD